MKIAMVCCWSSMRIYPIYSSSLRNALQELTGNKVAVLTTNCYCFDKHNPMDNDFSHLRLPHVPNIRSRSDLKYRIKRTIHNMNEHIRGRLLSSLTRGYDIVNFHQSSYAFGYESLKSFLSQGSKAKKVVTIHKLDQIQKENPELNTVYNKADAIIVFSNYMKDMLAGQGVDQEKIHVIYHGTLTPNLQDSRKEQAIVFCGSPIPHVKGFEHLAAALQMLQQDGISLRTKIYGFFTGDEHRDAIRLASSLGVEGLLNWQSFKDEGELVSEHQKSLMCLIPYTGYAGYFPAAYAMGNGVPVIATDILGHSEYVDGAGLLVEPASPEALVAAIKTLLGDESLRRQLAENGRRRAEQALTWETVAAQTLEVFASTTRKK